MISSSSIHVSVEDASKHRYLQVQTLVYADTTRRELELAICIDDELAAAHGEALDRIEAVRQLGISLGEAEPRPLLENDLEEQRASDSADDIGSTSAEDASHVSDERPPCLCGV